MTSGSVDGAGLISYLILVHVVVGTQRLTTMATVVESAARYQNLRSNVDIWPCSLPDNFDSIRESRGGSMCPAGPAVLGNMLVPQVSEEICVVDVVPDKGLWNVTYRGQFRTHVGLNRH